MSLEDFYLNLHIYVFFLLGFLAVVLIVTAGSSYRNRTGKHIISFLDVKHYSYKERKLLAIGSLILASSIVCLMLVLDQYGHNVRYIDENGNVEIKREKIDMF